MYSPGQTRSRSFSDKLLCLAGQYCTRIMKTQKIKIIYKMNVKVVEYEMRRFMKKTQLEARYIYVVELSLILFVNYAAGSPEKGQLICQISRL